MAESAASSPPLDLARLRGQTGGDVALEREVLTLFLAKSAADLERIARAASPRQRAEAAHALVGSARAVGALEVARQAEAVERQAEAPLRDLAPLEEAVRMAEGFIRRHLQP